MKTAADRLTTCLYIIIQLSCPVIFTQQKFGCTAPKQLND